MSQLQYDDFFQAITQKASPYDYQRRLACGERNHRPEAEWLSSPTECHSQLINIHARACKQNRIVLAKG